MFRTTGTRRTAALGLVMALWLGQGASVLCGDGPVHLHADGADTAAPSSVAAHDSKGGHHGHQGGVPADDTPSDHTPHHDGTEGGGDCGALMSCGTVAPAPLIPDPVPSARLAALSEIRAVQSARFEPLHADPPPPRLG